MTEMKNEKIELKSLHPPSTFNFVLSDKEVRRLIDEKLARAQRYHELAAKIGGQLETD